MFRDCKGGQRLAVCEILGEFDKGRLKEKGGKKKF